MCLDPKCHYLQMIQLHVSCQCVSVQRTHNLFRLRSIVTAHINVLPHIDNGPLWTEGFYTVLFRETCYQFKKGERHLEQQSLARGLLDSFEGKKTRVRRGPIDEGCSLRKKGASRNVSFIKTSGFSKQQSTALEKRLLLNERTPCGKRAGVHW